jgi:hydrogenase maturation protease
VTGRVLVAGVGNIFLGDDGFGVEVACRLAAAGPAALPAGVEVADFGIRGVHLAYQLLDGYDTLVLVDAAPRGEAPGTLSLIEADPAPRAEPMDAHAMAPDSVLGLLATLRARLGGGVRRVLVVGCEPADVAERIGLSPVAAAAVDPAVRLVRELVAELVDNPDWEGGEHDGAQAGPDRGAGRRGGAGPAELAGHRPLPADAADVR